MSRELFIGLISGTSMDGFDCALVAVDGDSLDLLDYISPPVDPAFRKQLLSVCKKEQVSLIQVGELDHLVARHFADTVKVILERNHLSAKDITAIGSHGQTIWHQPRKHPGDGTLPFTIQIGDPSLLSQLTGITVVADFRRRDMAAGGQAAPLVPAFHAWLFGTGDRDRIVLNIGGMSNITRLEHTGNLPVIAYDTGPGNVLLDAWIDIHLGRSFDAGGDWAASGKVNQELLSAFMQEPYLGLPPPKSTGRELFNPGWLQEKLAAFPRLEPEDVQATLLALTTGSVAEAIVREFQEGEVIVCGGGSSNRHMMEQLQAALPEFSVVSSAEAGMDPDAIEAAAFAWLACQTMHKKPVDLRSITGSSEPVILGGIYHHT